MRLLPIFKIEIIFISIKTIETKLLYIPQREERVCTGQVDRFAIAKNNFFFWYNAQYHSLLMLKITVPVERCFAIIMKNY